MAGLHDTPEEARITAQVEAYGINGASRNRTTAANVSLTVRARLHRMLDEALNACADSPEAGLTAKADGSSAFHITVPITDPNAVDLA